MYIYVATDRHDRTEVEEVYGSTDIIIPNGKTSKPEI